MRPIRVLSIRTSSSLTTETTNSLATSKCEVATLPELSRTNSRSNRLLQSAIEHIQTNKHCFSFSNLQCSTYASMMWISLIAGKGKRGFVTLYRAPHREHTSKALRYGTRSQWISQFYLHIPRSSANGMNHACLCLPRRSWLLIYRPRRDGRLSWPSATEDDATDAREPLSWYCCSIRRQRACTTLLMCLIIVIQSYIFNYCQVLYLLAWFHVCTFVLRFACWVFWESRRKSWIILKYFFEKYTDKNGFKGSTAIKVLPIAFSFIWWFKILERGIQCDVPETTAIVTKVRSSIMSYNIL